MGKKVKHTGEPVVFDSAARKDYVLGFRKRKAERRKKATDEIMTKKKVEAKRIRHDRVAKGLEEYEEAKASHLNAMEMLNKMEANLEKKTAEKLSAVNDDPATANEPADKEVHHGGEDASDSEDDVFGRACVVRTAFLLDRDASAPAVAAPEEAEVKAPTSAKKVVKPQKATPAPLVKGSKRAIKRSIVASRARGR
eukprot:GDKH01000689.1.p1 GENE.GDKH01000689.1~~GDKH01000689.1.p1  ORF type:complete len:196 (+),score=39.03 GDKH01000689.1:120-707(+)